MKPERRHVAGLGRSDGESRQHAGAPDWWTSVWAVRRGDSIAGQFSIQESFQGYGIVMLRILGGEKGRERSRHNGAALGP